MYSQLRVFAKYALKGVKGVLEDVDPDCKGFTLPESAVEPHTHFLITENTDDSNEILGQKLFAYMYTLNALIALLVGVFLLPSLFRIYDNADTNNKTFFENKIKVRFLVVTFLMSTYITLLYAIDIFHHIIYLENINLFVFMKVLYGSTTFGLVVIFIICYHCSCKDYKCSCVYNCKGIIRTLLTSLITLALALLILNILPFILLLFAHPMNTFALLGIHVALFYTETMAGILIIERLISCTDTDTDKDTSTPTPCMPCTCVCKCICSIYKWLYGECTCDWCTSTADSCTSTCTCDKCTHTYTYTCSNLSCSHTQEQKPLLQNKTGCWKFFKLQISRCCQILKSICKCKKIRKISSCAVFLFIGSGFVYFSVIIFYQFLFLRNLSSNNLGIDIIIKYLPSIAIGAFGFIIRKGTFSKEDKQEKYWLKLGELLNTTDDDHKKTDKAKHQKIAKLKTAFNIPGKMSEATQTMEEDTTKNDKETQTMNEETQ